MQEGIPDQERGRGQARDIVVGNGSMKPNFDFHPCLTLEKQIVVGLTCNFPCIWQKGSRDRSISPTSSTKTREALPQSRVEGENQLLKMVFHVHIVPPPFSPLTLLKEEETEKGVRDQRVFFSFLQMLNRKDNNFVIIHGSVIDYLQNN